MSGTGETTRTRTIRNTVGGVIAGLVLAVAAVVTPIAVNASNAAHADQVQQIADAKNATLVTRAAGVQDATLQQSAIDADTIAKHEAAVKQQEAEAAAAKAKAEAAAKAKALAAAQAQQAEQQQATQASTATDTGSGPAPADPPALTHCPAGSLANSADASGDTSCLPEACFHMKVDPAANPECVTPFKP